MAFVALFLFLLILTIKEERAFALAFFLQNTYFIVGPLDIGSWGLLLLFIRIVIRYQPEPLLRMLRKYFFFRYLFAFYLVGIMWSLNYGPLTIAAFLSSTRVLLSIVVFVLIWEKVRSKEYWLRLLSLTAIVSILNIFLLSRGLHPFASPVWEWGRLSARGLTGVHVNINTYAVSLVSVVAMWYLVLTKYGVPVYKRSFFYVIGVLGLGVLGLLGSRSAILTLLLILGLEFLNRVTLLLIPVLVSMLILANISGLSIPFIGEIANERLFTLQETELSSQYESSRVSIQTAGLQMFSDHFVLGVGTANSISAAEEEGYMSQGKALHNAFLTLMVEHGLVGLLLVVFFFGFAVKYLIGSVKAFFFFAFVFLVPNLVHNYFLVNITWMTLVAFEFLVRSRTPKAYSAPAMPANVQPKYA